MSSQSSLIQIESINQAYVKLHCEDKGIIEELSEFFTFMAPDYQFSPLFKARRWDGKIRLFSRRNHYLPAGLTRYVKVFAKQRGYEVQGAEWWKLDSIDEPIWEGLNLSAHGKPIEPYDHQKEAVIAALNLKRIVLESSTSSGKSLISYILSRYLLASKANGLIIVPTVNLVTQLYNDFADYSSQNGWKVEEHVHKIHQGQEKNTSHPLVISTWQSIHDMVDEDWFKRFDFVIGDEAHKFQAKSLTTIMNNLTNAEYRIGMTGTVQDGNVPRLQLEGCFGPIFKVMSNKEAMDKGISATLTIDAVVAQYQPEDCQKVRLMEYDEEMKFLVSHHARNNFITNLALGQRKNCLILINYIKHGENLVKELKKKDPNRSVYFIHGDTDMEDRERLRKLAETEENAIFVASYGVFQEGVSIINLHSIIFAHPSKSKVRVLQSIGRVLRMGDNKDTAKVYDIADDLRCPPDHVNYSLQHYLERITLYQREQFAVKVHHIAFEEAHQ